MHECVQVKFAHIFTTQPPHSSSVACHYLHDTLCADAPAARAACRSTFIVFVRIATRNYRGSSGAESAAQCRRRGVWRSIFRIISEKHLNRPTTASPARRMRHVCLLRACKIKCFMCPRTRSIATSLASRLRRDSLIKPIKNNDEGDFRRNSDARCFWLDSNQRQGRRLTYTHTHKLTQTIHIDSDIHTHVACTLAVVYLRSGELRRNVCATFEFASSPRCRYVGRLQH